MIFERLLKSKIVKVSAYVKKFTRVGKGEKYDNF